MDTDNDNCSTPKQRSKRLGLRRSSSIIKSKCAETKNTAEEKPVSTSRRKVAHSDMKINYRNLERNDVNKSLVCEPSTPTTPLNRSSTDIRKTVSTSCRPYRLALSKRVREKMTKKRLEFYLANEMEREDTTENQGGDKQVNDSTVTRKTFESREKLLQQIEDARRELTSRQEHIKKVDELKQAISVWRSGFSAALHDLQKKFEQRMEMAELLNHLNIPQEMIKYIND